MHAPQNVYLNLGSGPRGLDSPAWINIDGFKDENVHYLCDISRSIPFGNNVFDGIFCEHVLEHFTASDGEKLLGECIRILKKGGVIRIIVPNAKTFLKAYFDDPAKLIEYKRPASGYAMEAVNSWFYQRFEHQCIYDSSYLTGVLKKVGFDAVRECAFMEAGFGNSCIVIDDPKYAWESLYIEARK